VVVARIANQEVRPHMKLIPSRGRSEASDLRSEFGGLLERLFENDFESRLPAAFTRTAMPRVDVAESEKAWSVSVELPGLDEKDIQVQILGRHLQVSAERKWEEAKKGKEFHQVESQYGAFRRTIQLPDNARLDPDAISATYKKGVLEISISKVEPTPSARIPVKAG
jgi:HSP20 family protein